MVNVVDVYVYGVGFDWGYDVLDFFQQVGVGY